MFINKILARHLLTVKANYSQGLKNSKAHFAEETSRQKNVSVHKIR